MHADGFDGVAVHLANHDVMLWAVSRAPLATLLSYRHRMGWSFPWASSAGTEFNSDFGVAFTEEERNNGSIEYNYRREPADVDEFERHYREVHVPLAKKIPGLVRYSLSRDVAPARGGDPYYLVAALDWKDMRHLKPLFPRLRARLPPTTSRMAL